MTTPANPPSAVVDPSVPLVPVVPPPAPQPVQPANTVMLALLAPYVVQVIGLLGVIAYFIIHDNVDASVFFGFISVLIGFNAAGGAVQAAVHSITDASIQRSAIVANENLTAQTAQTTRTVKE